MAAYPEASARLYLLDRPVNLIDEGIDVALRIAHLADSNLVAIRVGEVRRVVAAAPRYLAQNPRVEEPGDLAKHQIRGSALRSHFARLARDTNGPEAPHSTAARKRVCRLASVHLRLARLRCWCGGAVTAMPVDVSHSAGSRRTGYVTEDDQCFYELRVYLALPGRVPKN